MIVIKIGACEELTQVVHLENASHTACFVDGFAGLYLGVCQDFGFRISMASLAYSFVVAEIVICTGLADVTGPVFSGELFNTAAEQKDREAHDGRSMRPH